MFDGNNVCCKIELLEQFTAVRQNGDIIFDSPYIRHFSVAHQEKTGQISGQIKLRMQFDCSFMLAVVCPVITGKTQVYRGTVDSIQRIFELEFMFGCNSHYPIKDFLKQLFENLWISTVHRFR